MQPPQPDGVDGEEVTGHDPGSLLPEERPPGGGGRSRCRVEPVTLSRRADGGCRDPNAEVQQFTLDALVAPARVLGGQADDQLLDVLVELWSPLATARVGPRACDEAPVPAQQRLGGGEEAGPAGSGEDPADRGQQGAVGGLEPGTWGLAAQHTKLVAQHEDLQVLGGVAAGEHREQPDGAAERRVGEFGEHPSGLRGISGGVTLPRHD